MVHLYRGKSKVVFGHDAILQRPALAAHIGAVATIWTVVEESWGLILAEALEAEAKTGVAMYLSLIGATSQRAVINEAIKAKLPASIQKKVQAARKAEKGPASDRNRIVHGRWGMIPDDGRYLALGERDWLPRAMAHHLHKGQRPEEYSLLTWHEHPDMEVWLYTEKDFLAVEQRLMAHYRSLHEIVHEIGVARQERALNRITGRNSVKGLGLLAFGQTPDEDG